jgi:hypothetical protein
VRLALWWPLPRERQLWWSERSLTGGTSTTFRVLMLCNKTGTKTVVEGVSFAARYVAT